MYSQQVAMSYCNQLHFIAFVCICWRVQNMNYINRNRHSIRNISNSLWGCMVYNCKRNWIYIIVFGHFSNILNFCHLQLSFSKAFFIFLFTQCPRFVIFFLFDSCTQSAECSFVHAIARSWGIPSPGWRCLYSRLLAFFHAILIICFLLCLFRIALIV